MFKFKGKSFSPLNFVDAWLCVWEIEHSNPPKRVNVYGCRRGTFDNWDFWNLNFDVLAWFAVLAPSLTSEHEIAWDVRALDSV